MRKTWLWSLMVLCVLLLGLLLAKFFVGFGRQSLKSNANHHNVVILAGDIGGTNIRLRLTQCNNQEKVILANQVYQVADYNNLIDAIRHFMAQSGCQPARVKSVCLGVASTVVNNEARPSSGKWFISAKQLETYFGTDKILLINDFEAIGYGLKDLAITEHTKDLYVLQKGKPSKDGLKAYIGAGTGFGIGFASWDDGKYVVHPSQGGHVGFAPTSGVQINILRYMRKKYGHALIGGLLSGAGIVDIYGYWQSTGLYPNAARTQPELTAACIAKLATQGKNRLASRTLETFVAIYGTQAREVAYTLLPSGGLYITGGIAPKTLKHFTTQAIFMKAFIDNGYLLELLKDIPIAIVLNTNIGLEGAEYCALKLIT